MTLDEATMESAAKKRLWCEAIIAARFGLVGITATVVHILVVSVLLSQTQFPTLLANTLAFLTALGISFTGNYLWTFQLPGDPLRAMRRFLLISVSAFVINTLILAAILISGWLSPFFAAIVSVAVIPLITFLASRLWGFQYASREVDQPGTLPEKNFEVERFCENKQFKTIRATYCSLAFNHRSRCFLFSGWAQSIESD